MGDSTKIALEQLGEKVERASKQTPEPGTFFTSTYNWVKKLESDVPEWGITRSDYVDNRDRDRWLMMMGRAEPHLASVLATAVTLDANRQYRLIGGRNQVYRFVEKFRAFDNGLGFRSLQELNAMNYYNSDVGSIVEIETLGKKGDGPLQSLYHTDPTRFRLVTDGSLKYDSDTGVVPWKANSFYRLASQRSTESRYNLLGFSAISRCIKLAQTMIAVVEHNLEKLGHIAPRGILFIQAEDLTQEAWDEAMAARETVYVKNTGNKYYDDVMVLVDRAAKGDLLALSQLPDRFDPFQFTDYMMKGYALSFGRPVRAFWSLNSGNFGGGTETKVQAEQATYGGAAEFILASQEQLQWLLPDSLLFEYEVEDLSGKLQRAEVESTLIEAAKGLLEIGVSPEYTQQWLAERGVLPAEWTDTPTEVADNGVMKARLLETEQVQRALENTPSEPIVMYESPSMAYPTGRFRRLWNNKEHAVGKSWVVSKKLVRQANIEDYEEEGESSRGDFMLVAAAEAMLSEYQDPDDTEEEALALALLMLNNEAERTEDNVNALLELLALIIPATVLLKLINLRRLSDDAVEGVELLYPERWNSRIRYFQNLGKLYGGDPDEELTWYLGDTIEHCGDCGPLDGVTKTIVEWIAGGVFPQDPTLECGGFYCDCDLR